MVFFDFAQGFDAVHPRHSYIQYNDFHKVIFSQYPERRTTERMLYHKFQNVINH